MSSDVLSETARPAALDAPASPASSAIRVSIVIATCNRASELCRTLDSLCQMFTCDAATTGAADSEVLVIDNNSTDDTPRVARDFIERFAGRLRVVLEPTPGLSHARNRGIAESRHEIIAFLDDDVEVDPRWLSALTAAFADGDWAAMGGRATLLYHGAKPAWLGPRHEGYLTRVDCGPVRREVRPDEVFGVNLSFRRNWIQRIGGFRGDLGRVGTRLLGGEDTDALNRIAAAGGRIGYEPQAAVQHRVAPARLRRRWFVSRCYWGHLCEPRTWPIEEITAYTVAREVWLVLRSAGALVGRVIGQGVGSQACFEASLRLVSHCGTLIGMAGRYGGLCWDAARMRAVPAPRRIYGGGQP